MQQIPLIDLFIDLFEFALHVSGDKLAHPQEYTFLTVYTAFGTMRRSAANIGALYQKLHIQLKNYS